MVTMMDVSPYRVNLKTMPRVLCINEKILFDHRDFPYNAIPSVC
jgi:hypothetical protein